METYLECQVRMTGATHIHWWNWTEGLGDLSAQQDLSVPLELTLGGFFMLFHLELLFVQLDLTT